MRSALLTAATVFTLFFSSGCCTIFGMASDQGVTIESAPSGATVTVDGEYKGRTPVRVDLNRRKTHQVVVSNGSESYEKELSPGLNPMLFGNIVFGGLIGIIVDTIDGASYALYPFSVDAQLGEKEIAGSKAQVAKAEPAKPTKDQAEADRRWKELNDRVYGSTEPKKMSN